MLAPIPNNPSPALPSREGAMDVAQRRALIFAALGDETRLSIVTKLSVST